LTLEEFFGSIRLANGVHLAEDRLRFGLPSSTLDSRFLVEPACGATLAIGYDKDLVPARLRGPVVLIVCGGNIVTPSLLKQWKAQTDAHWDDFST